MRIPAVLFKENVTTKQKEPKRTFFPFQIIYFSKAQGYFTCWKIQLNEEI